eukprot:707817-Ditylum_brightwellii.AAC.3
MQFGKAFKCLLFSIVTANPALGPVLMSKTDLSDAYMWIWLHIKDIPHLAFAITLHNGDKEPLIAFHLSVPMGYLESVAYFFCCATKTVADMVNTSWDAMSTDPNLLDEIADSNLVPESDAAGYTIPSELNHKLEATFEHLPPLKQKTHGNMLIVM